jgi:hypothetical protein
MECNKCLLTDEIAEIVDGTCEYCKIHDTLESSHNETDLKKIVKKIKKRKGYQAIIGISGGLDSTYLLHWAVKEGIKPLVVHFDNNYNNPVAERNMKNILDKLEVHSIRWNVPWYEYNKLNKAFIDAGVPDADIPNDMAMTAIIMDLADRYNIKYVLNGHDFRQEGSTPLKWTYMDAKYLQSVYYWRWKEQLKHFPLLTFWKQIVYSIKGIKQIRPYYYKYVSDKEKQRTVKDLYNWRGYGVKHGENLYTEWVGYKYLPENFDIDKRRIYLSAEIRTGKTTKKRALLKLENKRTVKYNFNTFKGVHRTRDDFKTYDFKKYKYLLWLLAKLKLVPYLFYKKYTK